MCCLYSALVRTVATGNCFSAAAISDLPWSTLTPGLNLTSSTPGSLFVVHVSKVDVGIEMPVISTGSLYWPTTFMVSLLPSMLVIWKWSPILRWCDFANCSSISASSPWKCPSSASDPPFCQSNL